MPGPCLAVSGRAGFPDTSQENPLVFAPYPWNPLPYTNQMRGYCPVFSLWAAYLKEKPFLLPIIRKYTITCNATQYMQFMLDSH